MNRRLEARTVNSSTEPNVIRRQQKTLRDAVTLEDINVIYRAAESLSSLGVGGLGVGGGGGAGGSRGILGGGGESGAEGFAGSAPVEEKVVELNIVEKASDKEEEGKKNVAHRHGNGVAGTRFVAAMEDVWKLTRSGSTASLWRIS